MTERRGALVLTSVCFSGIWLILFIVSVTEEVSAADNFLWASIIAAAISIMCSTAFIIDDVHAKRPWKSGIFNFEYYKLKKRTKKILKEFANADEVIRTKKQCFLMKAETLGIDLTIADDDFEEMRSLFR